MDEFQAVLKARELVKKVNPATIPVPVELYAQEVGAVIPPQSDMSPDEAGYCFENKGKRFICTNANDSPERQRFTVCHEAAHLRLGLPSQHTNLPWWSYAKRPLAEILCDVFAAELLLPYDLFHPEAEKASIGLSSIDNLAECFAASVTATGYHGAGPSFYRDQSAERKVEGRNCRSLLTTFLGICTLNR